MTLLFQGGTVVDPGQKVEKKMDLLVQGGQIADLGVIRAQPDWEVIDASGWILAPGFMDMHVHLREPGREDEETIETGSRAAAAGGFTSLMCMPNTTPVNDNEAVTRFVLDRARQVGLVNVFPAGAVTKGSRGEELAEIGAMFQAGVVAITDDGRPLQNNQIMRRALEYSRIFGLPVVDHCEDLDLAAGGCVNEGPVSTRLGLRGMSRTAEELHVVRDIMLSRVTGGHVHIAHLSTRESLQWVRQAKDEGLPVTCEVTPHHFVLSDQDIQDYDTNFKMKPPLRGQADVEAMLEGLADGSIDCIATDHAPHASPEKETTFEAAANGIIGLETAIPLAWEFLVKKGVVSVGRLVELFSLNPNRILSLGGGHLRPGAAADLTLIDPARRITVDVSHFESKSRNCPFQGWRLQGVPVMTVVGGKIIYRRSVAVSPASIC
ncbi:MAG: dihydroorotase [Acidobacteriota bacterium]